MKRALFLVAVLFLMSNLTWAQAAGAGPAPVADPRTAGGDCRLPDLAGLAPGQLPAAALNAGFQVTFVDTPAIPACPVTFYCNSISGCGLGPFCSETLLGPCCSTGGEALCCLSGNIIVARCPCKCTGGTVCSAACSVSTEVTLSCS